ncbi:MAG: transcriptional regulator [Rhizobiales bacterium]|nr:transcriptional regulator [Hyphomicrobiales bacterium]MBA68283.1 transcriptional regulator [Hyphomicrobiales bacterium]
MQKATHEPEWNPTRLREDRPPYLALLQLLQDDIENGTLQAGVRLPPHRKLAAQLGIGISTVTKAYRTAGQMGLIGGRSGQGTFVLSPRDRSSPAETGDDVNLGFNLSPRIGQREAIREIMADLGNDPVLDDLFAHSSIEAQRAHRQTIATWLTRPGFAPGSDDIVLTNGAQHGIDLALNLLAAPGAPILVEELTYVGFKALAATRQFPLVPVGMDEEGITPEALETALIASGAKVLYCMPTLQSPTARTMGRERREAIARLARKHDIRIIEDDVYSFLASQELPPIASLCPERTIHLSSFSKLLGLGFRLGAAVVPAALRDQAQIAVRATAWTTSALLTEIVARLLETGRFQQLADTMRLESAARVEMFRSIFADFADLPDGNVMGYHTWLPLPSTSAAQDLYYTARNQGLLLTPPGAAAVPSVEEAGIRICLGGDADRGSIQSALHRLRRIIDTPAEQFLTYA